MDLRETLSALDPADRTLSAGQHQRAAGALERILTAPPAPSTPSALPARPRYTGRRLALTGAIVSTAVVGAVTFLDLGGDDIAYASWTPRPAALSDSEISLVGPECRDLLDHGSLDVDRARLALAERRGEFVVLLYRTENPDMSGTCLLRNRVGSDDVDTVGAGTTGSSGPAQTAPPNGFVEGGFSQYREASVTDGAAGANVAAVTLHAGELTVRASVQNGRYAAWWPGPAFREKAPASDGRWELESIVTYDLTLKDGTVLRDVKSTRPS